MPQVQVSELAHRVPRCTPEVKILEPSSFLCILLSTKFHEDKNPRESHLSCYDQGLSPRHKYKSQIVSLWSPATENSEQKYVTGRGKAGFVKNSFQWKYSCHLKCSVVNSVQSSHSVVSNSVRHHGLQHSRLPCPPSPGAYSKSCPSCR